MSENIPTVWQRFATVCGTSAGEAREVLTTTIMPKANKAEVLAFIAVCGQYGLNPLRKEIYAFPSKGGIQPIVSIDGWLAIANRNPDHEAIETEELHDEAGALVAVKASVWKRGSSRPTTATEYLSECKRSTEPWSKWPTRMLTNKAMIQAIRRAYAVSGIMEPDEAERIGSEERREAKTRDTREVLLERAREVADVMPMEPAAYQPSDEDMADWGQPVSGDPEAAQ
jgi:phage recombination protein Bet